jgi:hypothetical protein
MYRIVVIGAPKMVHQLVGAPIKRIAIRPKRSTIIGAPKFGAPIKRIAVRPKRSTNFHYFGAPKIGAPTFRSTKWRIAIRPKRSTSLEHQKSEHQVADCHQTKTEHQIQTRRRSPVFILQNHRYRLNFKNNHS